MVSYAAAPRPDVFPFSSPNPQLYQSLACTTKMLRAVLCVIFLGALPASAKESRGHISVVLLGATGDLAKKYLWQGLFQLYRDEVSNGHSFTFHGAALTAPEPGQKMMFEVLKNLACPPDEHPTRCAVLKDQFLKLSQYYQLRTAENYTVLNREIETLLEQEGLEEAGRIFYFSVPPFAYAEIAGHINSSCRPRPGAWLRVVLEKPFGHDLESAQQLAAELRNFFKEEEMYRVDHYLGKQVRKREALSRPAGQRLHFSLPCGGCPELPGTLTIAPQASLLTCWSSYQGLCFSSSPNPCLLKA